MGRTLPALKLQVLRRARSSLRYGGDGVKSLPRSGLLLVREGTKARVK